MEKNKNTIKSGNKIVTVDTAALFPQNNKNPPKSGNKIVTVDTASLIPENNKKDNSIKKTQSKSHKLSEVPYEGDIQKTFQKSLTQDEINDLLDGYKKTDFDDLLKGHNVRYYSIDKNTNEMVFRTGGTIIIMYTTYVILSNSGKTWPVKKENVIFYQQRPIGIVVKELKEEFAIEKRDLMKEIVKRDKINKQLYDELLTRDSVIKKLEIMVKKLQKK
jgi:hypothetical protein